MVTVLQLGEQTPRLKAALTWALQGRNFETILHIHQAYGKERLLFAAALPASGMNLDLYRCIGWLREHTNGLQGTVAGILIDGEGEFYTKAVGRSLAMAANGAGCTFLGRPLVEGTSSLHNFRVLSKVGNVSLMEAYCNAARELLDRLEQFAPPKRNQANLLVLHASNRNTSNTLTLWGMVKNALPGGVEIKEITLRNGSVPDCMGCTYKTCMHYSEQGNCFYGGVMVEEVYPAVTACDGLLLLCPNYNDALGANISAFINRLTALFRKTPFFEKRLFGIIVSGYSGGDIVAEQLISSLNMNKSFLLPPYFCMLETANDPGEITTLAGIAQRAEAFAAHIGQQLLFHQG